VANAADAFGIDLLLANAGLGPFGPFLEAPEQALRDTIAVNVMATTLLLRRLLPGLLARVLEQDSRAGLVVVASSAAFLPVPNFAVYAASKAFDLSLTEALAAELAADPIDVLALCPTATRSGFAKRSGYRGSMPGAQDPGYVARAALAALGHRRTLVLGPLSGPLLSVAAIARAASAEAISLVTRRFSRT
jgi:short-subunit dehydrogenase